MFLEIPSDTKRLDKSITALISRASMHMSINNKSPVAVESAAAAAGGQELSVVLKTAPYRKHRAPFVSTGVMGEKKNDQYYLSVTWP